MLLCSCSAEGGYLGDLIGSLGGKVGIASVK